MQYISLVICPKGSSAIKILKCLNLRTGQSPKNLCFSIDYFSTDLLLAQVNVWQNGGDESYGENTLAPIFSRWHLEKINVSLRLTFQRQVFGVSCLCNALRPGIHQVHRQVVIVSNCERWFSKLLQASAVLARIHWRRQGGASAEILQILKLVFRGSRWPTFSGTSPALPTFPSGSSRLTSSQLRTSRRTSSARS